MRKLSNMETKIIKEFADNLDREIKKCVNDIAQTKVSEYVKYDT